tara:strand:+ start:283 stop:867 length:585 start_codon:yes stop_codon:yes gene_type:complete
MSTIKCKVIKRTTGPNCKPPENIGALTPSSSSTELHTKSAEDERIKKENAAAATLQGVVRGKKQREPNKREKTKQEEVKNLQEELKKLTSEENQVAKKHFNKVQALVTNKTNNYNKDNLEAEVANLKQQLSQLIADRSKIEEKLDKLNSSVGGKKIKRTHKKKSSKKRKKTKHKTIKKKLKHNSIKKKRFSKKK